MNLSNLSNLKSVAKFGGTSVADYDAMQKCAEIVINDPQTKVVVLSASSGVTNLLVDLASGLNDELRAENFNKVKAIQDNIINNLAHPEEVKNKIYTLLDNIKSLAKAASLATSDALTDELISHGEMMSTILFVEIIKERKCEALWQDVREIIKTNSNFGKAVIDDRLSQQQCDHILKPQVDSGKLVITQGFIGSDSNGKTTTLGRGGSDYTAALLAEMLNADNVLIWTDVAGIYTTDPRVVSSAKKIDTMSFHEAAEMATFGAKVLHPATLLPAVRSNIPVYVGSSKEPQKGGTWVKAKPDDMPSFRAIALRRDQTLLTLSSLTMLHAQGFLANVFTILAKHKVSVDSVTTSEVSVAITLDKTGSNSNGLDILSPSLLNELEQSCKVEVTKNLCLVALIGNNMHTSKGIANSIFNNISDYNVRMISYGASDNNICLLVNSEDADQIVNKLHKNIFD